MDDVHPSLYFRQSLDVSEEGPDAAKGLIVPAGGFRYFRYEYVYIHMYVCMYVGGEVVVYACRYTFMNFASYMCIYLQIYWETTWDASCISAFRRLYLLRPE